MQTTELTPHRLKSFLEVVRTGSFTKAAPVVHLTQSAISRQIAAMERSLGISLFDRVGKTVRLTEAGRTLLPEFRRIVGDLARIEGAVRDLATGEAGRFRIGASSTPGYYLLPPLLARFRRLRPRVEIEFIVANTSRVEELVVENAVDVGFVGGLVENPELLVEPFSKDEVVCFASTRHALANRRRIRPRDLGMETIVMREEGSSTRSAFQRWFRSAGGRIGRVIELGCPEAVKAVVASGLGVGCLSRLGLRDDRSPKRFAVLPIGGVDLTRSLSVVRHERRSPSKCLQEFVALVKGAT